MCFLSRRSLKYRLISFAFSFGVSGRLCQRPGHCGIGLMRSRRIWHITGGWGFRFGLVGAQQINIPQRAIGISTTQFAAHHHQTPSRCSNQMVRIPGWKRRNCGRAQMIKVRGGSIELCFLRGAPCPLDGHGASQLRTGWAPLEFRGLAQPRRMPLGAIREAGLVGGAPAALRCAALGPPCGR